MLVLSRKVGERIMVGNEVTITVVRVTGGGVRLGIEAPEHLPVVREELILDQPEGGPSNRTRSTVAANKSDRPPHKK